MIPGTIPLPYVMSSKELAQVLDVTPATLSHWRTTGEGPRFFRAGRTVRYAYTDVIHWMNSSTNSSTQTHENRLPHSPK